MGSVEDRTNNVRRGQRRVSRDNPHHPVATKKFPSGRQSFLDSIREQNEDVAGFYGNGDGRIFGLCKPAQRGTGAFQPLLQVSGMPEQVGGLSRPDIGEHGPMRIDDGIKQGHEPSFGNVVNQQAVGCRQSLGETVLDHREGPQIGTGRDRQ